MTAFLHFLTVAVALGLWMLLGLLEERIPSPHLRLWVRGLKGGTLAMVFGLLLAVGMAHGPYVVVPDEARTMLFLALTLAFGMIGFPIGFLAALARARREGE